MLNKPRSLWGKKTPEKLICRESSETSAADVTTTFLRNVAHKMDSDMIKRLSRSSARMRDLSNRVKIPDFVKTMFQVGEEYGKNLEDILKYYDAVDGNFGVVTGPMLIKNVVSDACAEAKIKMGIITENVPKVNMVVDETVPVSELIGDSIVVKDCLQELVYNALRHDSNNHVSLDIWSPSIDPLWVSFSVTNTGVPIGEENLAKIFQPFSDFNRETVRGSGLGIGLAKCKELVRVMGGELDFESDVDTVFTMTIPLRNTKALEFQENVMDISYERDTRSVTDTQRQDEKDMFPKQSFHETSERPSILVVDDSMAARKQFEKMMEIIGIDVETSPGPTEALKMAATKPYDIITLDILMPVMSGISCAERLREGGGPNCRTPIIFVTADSSTETRKLCSLVQDSVVMEKPTRRNVLFRNIMSSRVDPSKREYMRKYWNENT